MYAHATVMGVDFGSSSFKVALVQNKLLICENFGSGRKTHSSVAFRRGERLFGSDSKNAARFAPSVSYNYLRDLLGKSSLDDPQVAALLPHIFYGDSIVELSSNVTGSDSTFPYLGLQVDEETALSVPELMAMIFSHAKKIGENTAGTRVSDVAITVPVYFTAIERAAILDAAQIAGFNVLTLVNEPTAFAVNYATDYLGKADNLEAQDVMFIDGGHGSLQVSVFHYEAFVHPKTKKNATMVTTLASVWDRDISGREIERRLVEHFGKILLEKHGVDIKTNERARYRLAAQMIKSKEVLSANKDTQFLIESIAPDVDFGGKITRAELEELTSDMWEDLPKLLAEALSRSNTTIENISNIEMVGGSMRVPKFQEVVKEFFNRDSLDFHINSDEGAVFGAAFSAAALSSSHRVKDIRLRDTTPWRVWVEVSDLDDAELAEDEVALSRSTVLFRTDNRYSSKKTLSFHSSRDFQLNLRYNLTENSLPLPPGTSSDINTITFNNVPQKDSFNLTGTPKVHVQFRLTPSGSIALVKSEAEITVMEEVKKLIEVEEPGVFEKLQNFMGVGGSESDDAEESDDVEADEEAEAASETADVTNDGATEDQGEGQEEETVDGVDEGEEGEAEQVEEEEVEAEPQYEFIWEEKSQIVPLKAVHAVHSLPASTRRLFVKTLADYDELDRVRVETANSKNDLESYIYKTKELMWDDVFISVSTEEARELLQDHLSEASNWLYGDGADTTLDVYVEKKASLVSEASPIVYRMQETTNLPASIDQCLQMLNMTQFYFVNITLQRMVEEEEVEEVTALGVEVGEWLKAKMEAQKELPPFEDPILTSAMVQERCEPLHKKSLALLRRKSRPPPPPPKKEETVEEEVPEPEAETETETQEGEDGEENEAKGEAPEVEEEVNEQEGGAGEPEGTANGEAVEEEGENVNDDKADL
eukprot:TRINITY_DN2479_c0_g2_i1.p1 TRINITY_DN2479_c0_g2~~TRINITY_DN2479_c0_g2_i1.p1  ORF type:complete len:968 (-),score=344.72 TRINITY_DN2479_c0_g2_i1:18-2822(-)